MNAQRQSGHFGELPLQSDIAIRPRRVLDVEAGTYREGTVVCVSKGIVASVGEEVPAGYQTIDLPEHTLLPGLVDAHTHVFLHSNRMHDVTPQDNMHYMILQEYPSHRIARSVRALRIALRHGFTTIRDCGTEGAGYDDVGLRDAVNEGVIEGPRMQVAGPALTPTGTYPIIHFRPDWKFPVGVQNCDGPDECRRAVREQASYGIDWLKVYATAGYGSGVTQDGYIDAGPNWTKEEIHAIVDEAHARGLKVAAHATTITGTQLAIDAGVESIEHAHTIRPKMADQLAKRGIAIVPTLTTSVHTAAGIAGPIPPLWQRIPEVQGRSFKNCVEAGVKIVFGTDAGSGSIPWVYMNQAVEFEHQVALGLSPIQAIRTATTAAADLLGLEGKVGVIKAGAFGDLIGVVGDPLSDVAVLTSVDFVLKDGRIVKIPERQPVTP